MRERETERDRETETETDRERDTERERQTDRQRQTERVWIIRHQSVFSFNSDITFTLLAVSSKMFFNVLSTAQGQLRTTKLCHKQMHLSKFCSRHEAFQLKGHMYIVSLRERDSQGSGIAQWLERRARD